MQILIAKTQHSPMCQLLYFDVKLLIILNCFLIILSWSCPCDTGSLKFWHSICFLVWNMLTYIFQAADVLQECYSRFAVPANFLPSNAKVPHGQVDLQRTTCRHDTLFESSNVVIVSFNLPPFLLAFMQNLHAPFDFSWVIISAVMSQRTYRMYV